MKVKTLLSRADFDELLRPRLLLFLSVDVENSAGLKHRSSLGGRTPSNNSSEDWVEPFYAFFVGFEDEFADARGRATNQPPRPIAPPVQWKILGDEIVYAIELGASSEAGS